MSIVLLRLDQQNTWFPQQFYLNQVGHILSVESQIQSSYNPYQVSQVTPGFLKHKSLFM